jgi:hypothetical protein
MLSVLLSVDYKRRYSSTLCLSTPTGKLAKYDLKPGALLVVRGQATHCNLKVDNNPGNSRTLDSLP